MKQNDFIKQSIPISEIGLGAWQLGIQSGWQEMTENESISMVHKALESGVNFFDTAPNYGNGTSELRLGKGLNGEDRNKVVINTKFGHTEFGTINYNADYIRKSLEGSLKRLQTDYVDSLIIHNPPFQYLDGNKNDHYEILDRLKDEGKIKAYGASIDTSKEMNLLMNTTNSEVIEAFFNILHQNVAESFEMAKKKGVAVIAKIPLDSGWLSGKYNANSVFSDIRSRWTSNDIKTRASLISKLKNLIPEDIPLSQMAISFCLAYDAIATVIPGNTSIDQLEENIKSARHRMSPILLDKLEQFYIDEIIPLKLPW